MQDTLMQNTPIGIDTLHLHPQYFQYERNFGAIVRPASFDSRDGTVMEDDHALFSVEGKKFSGPEARRPLKTCVLIMKPHYDHKIKGSRVSPKITMTVPKIVGRDNYHPANVEQLREALGMVQAELAGIGFICDIGNAYVSRLDVARTIQTRDPWATYVPILASLKASRMEVVSFPTGRRWANPSCQIEFYEKGIEISSHYKKVLRAEVYARYPANSMRAELRWLQHAAFRDATGMTLVGEVLADFGRVQEVYRKQMQKRLFRRSPAGFDKLNGGMSVGEIVDEMRQVHKKHRTWFQEWAFMDWARKQSPERIETIGAAVKQFLSEEGLKPQNTARKLNKLKEYHLQQAHPVGSARSVADLYRELREMVLAE